MVQMAKFGPFPAPKWFNMVPTEFQASIFLLGINVVLMKFTLISISEAGGGTHGQVLAISGPHMVRDGPDWTPSIRFLLGINIALLKFTLISIYEAGEGPDGQVGAISGPTWSETVQTHPKWSKLNFVATFITENLL